MSKIRYELLRKAAILPALDHPSVGGAIMESLQDAEAMFVSASSYIPPWFNRIHQGPLVLAWGAIDKEGQAEALYIVERRVQEEELYVVREIFLDGGSYPIKSDCNLIDSGLTLREALHVRDEYVLHLGIHHFVDVLTEAIHEERLLPAVDLYNLFRQLRKKRNVEVVPEEVFFRSPNLHEEYKNEERNA